jgi:hypothetical protein
VLAKQYWTRRGIAYCDEDVESAFFTVEEITTPDDLIACASTMLMEYAAVFPKEPTEEFSQTILNTLTT